MQNKPNTNIPTPNLRDRFHEAIKIAPEICHLIYHIDADGRFEPQEAEDYIQAILKLILADKAYHERIKFNDNKDLSVVMYWHLTTEDASFWNTLSNKLIATGAYDNEGETTHD